MMDEQAPPSTFLGQYAGFVTRLVAFFIDRLVVSIASLVTVLVINWVLDAFAINELLGLISLSWQMEAIITAGISILFTATYDVGFWVLVGQTPGKRFLGVRVVRTDGERVGLGNAVRREIGYVISAILFLGFLWILFDNRRQGFHDKLAGTFVVYSWPEGELKGTFVREQVERIRHKRQMAQNHESS